MADYHSFRIRCLGLSVMLYCILREDGWTKNNHLVWHLVYFINDLAIDWTVALLGGIHWACWRSVSTIAPPNRHALTGSIRYCPPNVISLTGMWSLFSVIGKLPFRSPFVSAYDSCFGGNN